MLTHDNMLRNAWAVGQRMGITPDDRYFNCRPFFHVAGTTLSLLVALIAGACLVTLPTFEAGAALGMMARERCTLISGNDTLFQLLMGHPSFDPALLCLRGGWAAAGPETIRNIIEKLGARDVCVAYGLSEASPNVVLNDLSRSARPADRRTGEAARRDRGAHHAARHRRGAAGGRDRGDRGARLERHARLLQEPARNGQGTHARRLAAHRRHRCAHRRRPAAHGRARSRICSASAARTSPRPRSRRCCSRIPPSRPRKSSVCPIHGSARWAPRSSRSRAMHS